MMYVPPHLWRKEANLISTSTSASPASSTSYVPPHLRHPPTSTLTSSSASAVEASSALPAAGMDGPLVPLRFTEISPEEVNKCCMLLTGVSSELSELTRARMLRPLLNRGAKCKWLSPTHCILSFPSSAYAQSAKASSPMLQLIIFNDLEESIRQEYYQGQFITANDLSFSLFAFSSDLTKNFCTSMVCCHSPISSAGYDLYSAMKPSLDPVANRLIGAALGIGIHGVKGGGVRGGRKSAPVKDAWD